MAEQAASDVTYVITYTNAPYTYDRSDTLLVNTEEGMEDGRKVRSVKTPADGVEAQRARYASGLHLCDDEATWQAKQSTTANKEVSKKMDKRPTAPKCKNHGCTYKDKNMKLVDGRCKMCAAWFKKHGTERKTGLQNDVKKPETNAPMAETPVVPTTPETVVNPPVAAVDTPLVSADDALDAMMAETMAKTATAVTSCSDREKAAKAAMAAAKAELAAVKAEKLREKEAKLAQAAEAQKSRAAQMTQAQEAKLAQGREDALALLNTHPELRAALLAGGTQAIQALQAAMAAGTVAKGTDKKARAPKLNADGTPKEKKAPAARTSGRVLTNEELMDIQARLAAGEKVTAIAAVHGLHHVTVSAIAKGLIKSK